MSKNENEEKPKLNKKVIIIIIAIIIVMCVVIMGVILMNNNKDNQKQEEKQKDTILLKDDLKFEINSEVNLLSLVSEDNKVKIVSEDKTIDTSTLGENEITIKYEVKGKEEEKTFKIAIVDTQAPTIEYQKELSTNVGTEIDLLKDVKVSDNSKEEIKATVDGDYSFDNEGTYNLKYVAVDSSNNRAEEEFILVVTKETTTSNNNSSTTNANNNSSSNNTPTNNSSNTTKPSNDTGSTNSSSGTISSGKDPYALLDKYVAIYGAQLTNSPAEFSPEPGVNIWTIPVKWHYEWNPIYERWDVVTDLNGFMSGSEETAKKLYPVPNRPGTDNVVTDENGVSHHTPEKTQVYSAYRYGIETY